MDLINAINKIYDIAKINVPLYYVVVAVLVTVIIF
jgi:hypothetical protein